LPLLAVAFFCFVLWALSLIRSHLYAAPEAHQGAATALSVIPSPDESPDEAEGFVEFTLPGSWAEPGFRHRRLGVDGQHELCAEEVYLRIRAERNMQAVRVKIAASHGRRDALEAVEIESAEWTGVVTKGREQSFMIMQRTYWNVPHAFTHPTTGQQGLRAGRVEKEAFLFPENPQRFSASLNHIYFFRVTVHHDKGPDTAEFSIELKEQREGPQSFFRLLRNIEPVGK
jgi:hypothetical protein